MAEPSPPTDRQLAAAPVQPEVTYLGPPPIVGRVPTASPTVSGRPPRVPTGFLLPLPPLAPPVQLELPSGGPGKPPVVPVVHAHWVNKQEQEQEDRFAPSSERAPSSCGHLRGCLRWTGFIAGLAGEFLLHWTYGFSKSTFEAEEDCELRWWDFPYRCGLLVFCEIVCRICLTVVLAAMVWEFGRAACHGAVSVCLKRTFSGDKRSPHETAVPTVIFSGLIAVLGIWAAFAEDELPLWASVACHICDTFCHGIILSALLGIAYDFCSAIHRGRLGRFFRHLLLCYDTIEAHGVTAEGELSDRSGVMTGPPSWASTSESSDDSDLSDPGSGDEDGGVDLEAVPEAGELAFKTSTRDTLEKLKGSYWGSGSTEANGQYAMSATSSGYVDVTHDPSRLGDFCSLRSTAVAAAPRHDLPEAPSGEPFPFGAEQTLKHHRLAAFSTGVELTRAVFIWLLFIFTLWAAVADSYFPDYAPEWASTLTRLEGTFCWAGIAWWLAESFFALEYECAHSPKAKGRSSRPS